MLMYMVYLVWIHTYDGEDDDGGMGVCAEYLLAALSLSIFHVGYELPCTDFDGSVLGSRRIAASRWA